MRTSNDAPARHGTSPFETEVAQHDDPIEDPRGQAPGGACQRERDAELETGAGARFTVTRCCAY
jgi:hypothetical protein